MAAALRRPALAALVLAVGAVGTVVSPASAGESAAVAPVRGTAAKGAIKDRYVVVFAKGTKRADVDKAGDDAKRDGGRMHFKFRNALNGFAGTLPAKAVERLQKNPRVSIIEADQEVRANDTTQAGPPWGLDRIDQRALPLNNAYTYGQTASNVRAYVIDTGIRATHADFGGRVGGGYNAIGDSEGTNDCNGHGTHVAGTIGGSTYGVAKSVQLVPVRVLDCNGSGSYAGVIAGVDWVTGDHDPGELAVANMSLGGGTSSALDTAIANSIADGVTYAVAAGNDNSNACNGSPARAPQALTVGATTSSDARASYSNYGSCVDLFAPGSAILSAWNTSNTATNTINGTSMASPHVAGAAAVYLGANPSASPASVGAAITSLATSGVVGNAGSGSPNRLLYTGGSSTPPPPPPPPPSTCAAYPTVANGTLANRATQYQPGSGGYTTSVSGVHKGCLDGPSGVDFDLYLQKRGAFGSWSNVASGTTSAPDEAVTYSGSAGTYRWRVVSYSGSGAYTLGMQRP